MKIQAGWTSLFAIHQNLSLRKHFLHRLGKAASHYHQVIAINFRSLLYRELLRNFLSSPRMKQNMNMRMKLMMTSVSLLHNFSSLQIMVWKKILSMRTKMPLQAITSQTINFQDVPHPWKRNGLTWKCWKRRTRILSFGMQWNVLVSFLVLKNHPYPCDFDRSKVPKKTRFLIAQTMRNSVLFATRSKVVPRAWPWTKGTKKLSGYFLLRKSIPGTITGEKRRPPKTGLPSKIFLIDF